MLRTLLSLFWVCACMAPAPAQLWKKTRIDVKPGLSLGPVEVGKPLSAAATKYLGKAQLEQAAGSEPASGYLLFGSGDSRDLRQGILIRLHDGKDPKHVHSVQVKGLRAATREGVFLGGAVGLIGKHYLKAQKDTNPFTRNPEYCLPGLTIRTKGSKVEEFVVESKDAQRWRFQEIVVVPGESAGPIELGKPLSAQALELLGPPTLEVKPGKTQGSGILRWAIAGQSPNRMIEALTHNGRNPRAVVSVRLRGIPAQTDRKIKLGDSASAVRDLYPDGREGLHEAVGGVTWRVPGANFLLNAGQLKEIFIYQAPTTNKVR